VVVVVFGVEVIIIPASNSPPDQPRAIVVVPVTEILRVSPSTGVPVTFVELKVRGVDWEVIWTTS
jgi:hypothetical protein